MVQAKRNINRTAGSLIKFEMSVDGNNNEAQGGQTPVFREMKLKGFGSERVYHVISA